VFESITPLSYRCGGCEYQLTFGAGSNPLSTSGALTAGTSTALSFASGGTQFSLIGSVLFINDAALSEIVVVNGTATGTSVPISGLDNSHASGKAVTVAVAAPTFASVESILQTPY
jgi:hypothetical protein